MKKIAIIIALLAINISFSFAQTVNDSVLIKKVGKDYQFYQNDEKLNMSQLLVILRQNDLALKQIKSAQASHTFGLVLGMAGGFMVGYPIGTALGGGEPNWTSAIVGGALVAVAIPISMSFTKKAHRAIETYNAGLQTTSFWDTHELRFSFAANGVGFTLNF